MLRFSGKVPIGIHPSFFLIAAFLSWQWGSSLEQKSICFFCIFFSILLHELGHAFAATFFGQKAEIQMGFFGGSTYHSGKKPSLFQELFIVASGPAMTFLISALSHNLLSILPTEKTPLTYACFVLSRMNMIWLIFNLLPIYPLDGGKILKTLLEFIIGYRALLVSSFLGAVMGFLSGLLCFFYLEELDGFIMGSIFFLLAFESGQMAWNARLLSKEDGDDSLKKILDYGKKSFVQGDLEGAMEKFEWIRKQSQSGIVYTQATEHLAHIYSRLGRFSLSYEVLYPLRKTLSYSSTHLLQKLAYQRKEYYFCLSLGKKCFQETPSHEVAILNAYAAGALKKVRQVIGWFHYLEEDTSFDIKEFVMREEFDFLREDKLFSQYLRSLLKE